MSKVFVVQEFRRYHCPKCDGAYSRRASGGQFGFVCNSCQHEYAEGVLKTSDLSAASVYGDLEVLIKSNNIGISLQPLVNSLKSALKDFSDDDYILTVGDPVAIGLVSVIAARANRGRVTFLRWDRQTRAYIKIKVET